MITRIFLLFALTNTVNAAVLHHESTLPRDMMATGAIVGGTLLPALIAIPMWENFISESSKEEYDEYSLQKVSSSLTTGSLLSGILAPGFGLGAYLIAGGEWNDGRVMQGSLIGAAIAYPIGGGLAALAIQPILSKEYNQIQVNDKKAPYRVGSIIWFGTISAGAVLGGLIGTRPKPDYAMSFNFTPNKNSFTPTFGLTYEW